MSIGRTSIAKLPRVAKILVLAATATATLALGGCTNRVPNHGFEVGGCDDTPVLCGWDGSPIMEQSPDAHSGQFSMGLGCGHTGCYTSGGFPSVRTHVVPAACPPIGPGKHAASVWFKSDAETVALYAVFYPGPSCTGEALGADFFDGSSSGPGFWQKLNGTLLAPSGTQSAEYQLYAIQPCDDFCGFGASFDDIDVEAEVSP
jgi:hypothetical protein